LDEHDPAVAVASECSKLERELTAANNRIKRLEEAGRLALGFAAKGDFHSADEVWNEAKEAKP
jgi:hypothetical protein